MTTSAAQDEFNELIRDKDRESRHPEDRHNDRDLSEPESPGAADDYLETTNTDDEFDIPHDMRANYYLPSLRSDANTGPKGVIADARAFEQAKKKARRFTLKKNSAPTSYTVKAYHDKDSLSDEDSDDSFLKEWRQNRLQELQNVGQRIRSRTTSPSRRIWGNMPLVDTEGFIHAIEKAPSATTVVVFISVIETEPESEAERKIHAERLKISKQAEEYMREVAKRNDTVCFVNLPGDLSTVEDHQIFFPAVQAYKEAEEFGSMWVLPNDMPKDTDLSVLSLETFFREKRIL